MFQAIITKLLFPVKWAIDAKRRKAALGQPGTCRKLRVARVRMHNYHGDVRSTEYVTGGSAQRSSIYIGQLGCRTGRD